MNLQHSEDSITWIATWWEKKSHSFHCWFYLNKFTFSSESPGPWSWKLHNWVLSFFILILALSRTDTRWLMMSKTEHVDTWLLFKVQSDLNKTLHGTHDYSAQDSEDADSSFNCIHRKWSKPTVGDLCLLEAETSWKKNVSSLH